MANLGHHDEHAHLAGDGPNVVVHGVLGGEGLEGRDQVLGRLGLGRAKVHAHEEAVGHGVAELLQVQDVVLVGGEDARHGVHDAGLVRAGQREDVVIGHVEGNGEGR